MISTITITVDPSHILIWAFVGLVAGFVASRLVLGRGLGLIGDALVGLTGALAGGFLAAFFRVSLTVPRQPIASEIIVAFLGAVLLLVVFRLFAKGRRRAPLIGRH